MSKIRHRTYLKFKMMIIMMHVIIMLLQLWLLLCECYGKVSGQLCGIASCLSVLLLWGGTVTKTTLIKESI